MPKVSPLAVSVIALVTAACSVETPAAPVVVGPLVGVPAKIELSAVPGVGGKAGTAAITARVLDAGFAAVPNATVTFSADAGTLSAIETPTNGQGIATTTLTATAGNHVKVRAEVGRLDAQEIMVAIQADPVPAPEPPTPVPPTTPPSTPDLPFTIAIGTNPAGAGLATTFGLAATGVVTSASWTFGDSIGAVSNGPNTSHVYANAGTFAVSVVATDNRGRTASASTSVAIPTGSFAVTLTPSSATITAGFSVTLTAVATPQNTPAIATTYVWDCGNGSPTTTDALTTHVCTYLSVGTKTPKVTATNGPVTGTGSASVAVNPPEITVTCPTVTFPNPTPCTVSAKVNGAVVPDSNITSVTWNFGDGSPAVTTSIAAVSHTYPATATFTVSVSAVAVAGATAQGSGTATAVVTTP